MGNCSWNGCCYCLKDGCSTENCRKNGCYCLKNDCLTGNCKKDDC